jgi:hypothetical protein
MERALDGFLERWRDSASRKPLLLRGVRQVGKTYAARELGRRAFAGGAHIVDLERDPGYAAVFAADLDPRRILDEIGLRRGAALVPGRDLLVLDEIQACPSALTSLCYFKEELPELHVIAAGSLLEFALGREGVSFPVGRITPVTVRPLSFFEFLRAVGNDVAAEMVASKPREVSAASHDALLQAMRDYLVVGGMPAAVAAYAADRQRSAALEQQRELVRVYRDDFPKYRPASDPELLDEVLANIARGIGGQLLFTRLARDRSRPTVSTAFRVLARAGLAEPIHAASPAGLPLGASRGVHRFKAILADLSFLHALSGLPVAQEIAREDLLDIYAGALAEQYVGQELLAGLSRGGSEDPELFYWAGEERGSTAEVDYLIAAGGRIVAIEVKASRPRGLSSLKRLLEKYPGVPVGHIVSSEPYAVDPARRIVRVPLYWAARLTD